MTTWTWRITANCIRRTESSWIRPPLHRSRLRILRITKARDKPSKEGEKSWSNDRHHIPYLLMETIHDEHQGSTHLLRRPPRNKQETSSRSTDPSNYLAD